MNAVNGLSRRSLLQGALLLGGASLLSACGAGASRDTAPGAGTGAAPAAPPTSVGAPAATAAASGAQTAPAAGKPAQGGSVKVGVLLPFTQVYAQLGQDALDGMELYFDEVKRQAGGREITLVKEDEGVEAAAAVQKARKLMESDRVDIFTGFVSTPIAYAARDMLHEAKLPTIVSTAGGNDLTRGRKSPYIFRTSYTAWQLSYPLGDWVARNVGKKLIVTAADYAFGRECAEGFKASFTAAGGTVLKELYPKFPNTDYGPYLPEIERAKPEATYNFYAGSDAVNFVKQYEEFGLKKAGIKLTGSGPMLEEDTFPAQGAAALGGLSALHWARTLDNPENRRFLEGWAARYKRDPSVYAVHGYDTAHAIVEALNRTSGRTDDRDALAGALRQVSFASPRGPFAFDPATNHVVHHIYVREVRPGPDGKPTNFVVADLGVVKDPGA